MLSQVSRNYKGNFPGRWAQQASAPKWGQKGVRPFHHTPLAPSPHFACHDGARCLLKVSPAPPDETQRKTADGSLTFYSLVGHAVCIPRVKCGQQVPDKGLRVRAREAPAKSPSPGRMQEPEGWGGQPACQGYRCSSSRGFCRAGPLAVSSQPDVCYTVPQGGHAKAQCNTAE